MNAFLSAEQLREQKLLPRNLPEKAAAKCTGLEDILVSYGQLERLLDDRRRALDEPKVEKLSSLVRGEWLPEKRLVAVIKHTGKHLQHMGTTVDARQMLHPEEALYLMDTKCMEMYHKGLPLSEQEAFSIFFTCETDMLKWQVYSHLSRLGYIVVRHRGRSTVSEYERAINLDKYVKGSRKKRQACNGGSSQSSQSRDAAGSVSGGIKMPENRTDEEPRWSFEGGWNVAKKDFILVGNTCKPVQPCLLVRHPEISIPNAYGKSLYALLAPKLGILPANVKMRKEMYTLDLQKLYRRHNMAPNDYKSHCSRRCEDTEDSLSLRLVETSRRREGRGWKGTHGRDRYGRDEGRRARKRNHRGGQVEEERPRTKAQSWKQYKEELLGPQEKSETAGLLATPSVRPILEPAKAESTASILSELQIIPSVSLTGSCSASDQQSSRLLDLTYDVYLPTAEYSRNAPALPNHRLVVTSASDPLPDMCRILRTMRYLQDGIPIHFAVVNNGDVAFYSFKDVRLPTLVSMG